MIRRYSAALVLTCLAVAFMVLQLWTGWVEYAAEQADHRVPALFADYLWSYGARVFENLQSEAWQIVIAAWVFKHFFWKGSPESKDPEED